MMVSDENLSFALRPPSMVHISRDRLIRPVSLPPIPVSSISVRACDPFVQWI